jgi:hypothetical protein
MKTLQNMTARRVMVTWLSFYGTLSKVSEIRRSVASPCHKVTVTSGLFAHRFIATVTKRKPVRSSPCPSVIIIFKYIKTRMVSDRSNTGIVGSNPTRGRMYVCVSLCYAVLCRYRPCDEPIPRTRSPTKTSIKGFKVSEVSSESNRPQDLMSDTNNIYI